MAFSDIDPRMWREAKVQDFFKQSLGNEKMTGPTSLVVGDVAFTSCAADGVIDAVIFEVFFKYSKQNSFQGISAEFGAQNGMFSSNTWFFTHFLEWKSLLIEASPSCFGTLSEWMQDPAYHKYDDGRLKAFHGGVCASKQELNVANSGGSIFSCPTTMPQYKDWDADQTVPCERFEEWVHLAGHDHIDFVSMDCEGCEKAALRDIDWSTLNTGVVVVEWVYFGDEADDYIQLMREHGFQSVPMSQPKDDRQRGPHDMIFYSPSYFQRKYDEEGIQLTSINDYL